MAVGWKKADSTRIEEVLSAIESASPPMMPAIAWGPRSSAITPYQGVRSTVFPLRSVTFSPSFAQRTVIPPESFERSKKWVGRPSSSIT